MIEEPLGQARVVRGRVRLPAGIPAGVGTLVVQVEDVSRADAPAPVIAEVRRQVSVEPGGMLEFELPVSPGVVSDRASYSLRVHIDRSGSGRIDRGDLISTQSYPVLTRGARNEWEVAVRGV